MGSTIDSATIETVSRKGIVLHGGVAGLRQGLESILQVLPFQSIETNVPITSKLKRSYANAREIQQQRTSLGVSAVREKLKTKEGRTELATLYFPDIASFIAVSAIGTDGVFYLGEYLETPASVAIGLEHINPFLNGEPYQTYLNESYLNEQIQQGTLPESFLSDLTTSFRRYSQSNMTLGDFARSVILPCVEVDETGVYVVGNVVLSSLDRQKLNIADDEPVPLELVERARDLATGITLSLSAVADAIISQHLYEELQSTQHQLVLSESRSVLANLAQDAAHNINNVAKIIDDNLVIAHAMLKKQKYDGVDPCLTSAATAVARLKGYTLRMSRLAEPVQDAKLQNITESLDDVLSLYDGLLHISKDYRPTPQVNVSRQEMASVFQNLIDNALASYKRKSIPEPKRVLQVTTTVDQSYVVISFSDHAGGIPEKDIERAFDTSYTTRLPSEGKGGFGLKSCQMIMASYKGNMTIENQPEGLMVNLYLPL
ncbi:sensor histidine kinase [Candidatus Woesearchaeota archaeon]|nr:MAG: sensor histidine kinase [Candidatus Woesearchaeota archaeon]